MQAARRTEQGAALQPLGTENVFVSSPEIGNGKNIFH